MATTTDNHALLRATLPLFRLFSPDLLRQILEIQADEAFDERVEELAGKANEGELTEGEREEYLAYIQANSLVSTLQGIARQHLESSRP